MCRVDAVCFALCSNTNFEYIDWRWQVYITLNQNDKIHDFFPTIYIPTPYKLHYFGPRGNEIYGVWVWVLRTVENGPEIDVRSHFG